MFENLEAGKEVLNRFNYWMSKLHMKSFSLDEIARASGYKDTSIFVAGIGDQYVLSEVWSSTMDSLMKKIALASGGKIPLKPSFDAIFRDQATNTFSFAEVQKNTNNAAVYVAAGIADKILDGAQSIGKDVIETGDGALKAVVNSANVLKYVLPVLVVGGIGFYFYLQAKSAPRLPSK